MCKPLKNPILHCRRQLQLRFFHYIFHHNSLNALFNSNTQGKHTEKKQFYDALKWNRYFIQNDSSSIRVQLSTCSAVKIYYSSKGYLKITRLNFELLHENLKSFETVMSPHTRPYSSFGCTYKPCRVQVHHLEPTTLTFSVLKMER